MSRHLITRLDKKLPIQMIRTGFCGTPPVPSLTSCSLRLNFALRDCTERSVSSLSHIHKNQFSSKMADASEEFRHLDYSQLMDLRNKEKHILIDVREKSELEDTGAIPGAFHIPVGEIDKAFSMSEDDFKKTYNFIKPSHDDQVIFSCRSGKRSLMALEKAIANGYSKAKHYKGGWLDWEQHVTSH